MNRLEVLEQTVAYYSEDVNRRCINPDGTCRYSGKTVGKEGISEGCAVGRLLSSDLRNELDNEFNNGASVSAVFNLLPEEVQELGEHFLQELQFLHDWDFNWNKNGLSEVGKEKVEYIKQEFNLI